MQSTDSITGEPELNIIELSQDHMIDHPAGAHYALWNGPAFLDIGVPGGFVRFAVANLSAQWTLLMDAQGQPLPVAARYDGRDLAISWLPYDGPGATTAAEEGGGGLSDADYAAALQNISATRYQGLMDAAWGIGGWSTYRSR